MGVYLTDVDSSMALTFMPRVLNLNSHKTAFNYKFWNEGFCKEEALAVNNNNNNKLKGIYVYRE